MALYWQQHQLSFDPFMTEDTNEVAYLSPRYEQQLDLLAHLVNNEDKIQLVTGLTGIGKSTMMRLLMKELSDASGICKVYGGATITPDVLQALIARHLGLKVDINNVGFYKQALQNKMMQMQHRNENFFLLIDNAHKLPKESLAFLLQLMAWQVNSKHVIHVALFGGPQLEAIFAELTATAMGERSTHTIRLEPLNDTETKQYIMHRLTLAGWRKEDPFSDGELAKIMHISKGIPSKINYVVKQLLLQKTQSRNETKSAASRHASLKQLIIGVSAVAAVFVIVQAYKMYEQQVSLAENKQTLKLHAEPLENTSKNLTQALNHTQTNVERLAVKKTEEWPDYMKQNSVSAPQNVTASKGNTAQSVSTAQQSKKITTHAIHESNTLNDTDTKAENKILTEANAALASEAVVAANKNTQAPSFSKQQSNNMVMQVETMQPKKKVVTVKKSSTQQQSQNKVHYAHDELVLLNKNKNHYAIQLAGSHDFAYLQQRFLKAALDHKIYYFKTVLHDKAWYVAVYGDYTNEDLARKAIHGLTPEFQKNKPWPRSYNSIQHAIKVS